MNLPYFQADAAKTRQQILQWKGLQYGITGQDGELTESQNLSSRQYPALTQRRGRTAIPGHGTVTAAYAKDDTLITVENGNLLCNGKRIGEVGDVDTIVAVNSKILLFPAAMYYDTATEAFGTMAVDLTIPAAKATFTGQTLTLTENPVEGKSLADIFAVNQAVELRDCSIEGNNKTIIIRAVEGNTLTLYSDSFTAGSSTTDFHIARKMPELRYVCENSNRLWGVDDTTIWASALGDPLTFYNYDGLSTDSYAVSLGSDGRFTGICSYGSNVLIFEENAMHKLMGSEPGEYAINSYTVPGVQAGSGKSLCVVNEVLYYKGVAGVYAYTSAAPTLASECFGVRRFDSARGGTDGHDYYISMRDSDSGAWGLWVLDTLRGIWLREDETQVQNFFRYGSQLCYLAKNGSMYKTGQDDREEGKIPWQAVLAPFDWSTPERKQFVRLYLHAELEQGAWFRVELREDDGPWRQAYIHHAQRKKTMAIPIAPNRCDSLQLRLTGEGRCLIRQVAREYVIGGSR